MSKRESLKILTIGNSFTDSLAAFFQQVVESAGCQLHFERANHGGCELHRHWSYIENEERDGVYSLYQDRRYKMREILAREKWDVVTVQQASHCSWRYETFQPFANNIINYVHTHAPDAEVCVQQTWAYREDDPRIRPGNEWKYDEGYIQRAVEMGAAVPSGSFTIGQSGMYENLTKAYTSLASENNLRVIPTGYAVQLTRQYAADKFTPYDESLMTSLKWPDMPLQAGDVVGQLHWRKDKETGEMKLGRDTIHLNQRGQYLQACVWFAFLFGAPTSEVTFVPEMVSDSDALFLRQMAQKAVDEFKAE